MVEVEAVQANDKEDNSTTLTRCPVCRGRKLTRENDELVCGRCGSDLSDVENIINEAEDCFLASIDWALKGNYFNASCKIENAIALKNNTEYVLWQQFINRLVASDY